ncbi:MOSC domain-containing protein-containing protein [Roseivivax marinus]|uniref:MOSC domain-containing protein-containing protein n=1 Tax=Roseivivax marinus TaxID=1379903 RepID=W4HIC0_9RHOB|nr:MOSC N-terminal beta barrel domain-containing protein [Roseivivax marinus]ETW12434.1 MOSC domain-containing protein-containing protein [Roseivivax marinus]
MTARVIGLWRHPVKAIGREAVTRATLTAGQTFPWDRAWAAPHARSRADGSEWAHCGSFARGVNLPALMAVEARFDEAALRLSLTHPDRPSLTVDPDTEGAAIIDWLGPLVGDDPRAPVTVVRAAERGMTDSDWPSVTLCNRASHVAVEEAAGRPLSIHRWRGNVWIDGLSPWAEMDWIGHDIRIGGVTLRVREATGRCKATHADPETGVRDLDMLSLLSSRFGHTDFSVKAEVISGGDMAIDDEVTPL